MDYTIASNLESLEAYSNVVTAVHDSPEFTRVSELDKPWTNVFWNDAVQVPQLPKDSTVVTFSPTYFEGSIRFTDRKMFITNLPGVGPLRLLCNTVCASLVRSGSLESVRTPTSQDSPWYADILKQLSGWCVEFKNAHGYRFFFVHTILEQRPDSGVDLNYVWNKVSYKVICAGVRTP